MHREQGTVIEAGITLDCDHNILLLEVRFRFPGGEQSLQATVLEQEADSLGTSLCAALGVGSIGELEGRQCYALRSWPEGRIDGIELEGRRFVLKTWERGLHPGTPTRLEERQTKLRQELRQLRTQLELAVEALAQSSKDYVEWESMP